MSSAKKDMRRPDLVIPYQVPVAKESAGDINSTLSSTMPMAAMFTRNKYVGWASVVFAVQNWLGEGKASSTGQPAILSVGMSLLALVVTYLPMFMQTPAARPASGTEAPAAVPA